MNLHQFLSILRARWLTALLVFTLVVAAAVAYAMLRPTDYTARAPVLVDVNASDVGGGYSPAMLSSYIATQIDIARSDRVTERVLGMLQGNLPEGLDQSFRSTTPEGQRRELVERLQERLSVRPARESNIISIAWTGSNPADAARVANAFAQAYVDTALELKTNPARQESVWFDEQVKAARQKLEQAQLKLSEFQQRAGIVGEEVADHEMARLTTLSTQLAQVQAMTTDSLSKRGASLNSVAEVMQSPLVNGLKADINRLEAQIEQRGASWGPRHPQMIQMQAELQSLRSRLATETSRIGTSIDTSYETGRARERELQAALNAQRARVLAVNKDRGMLALLRQDVQTAQQAYNQVSENSAKVRLQSLTTMTNLRPLAPAVEPTDPIGPSKRATVGIAAGAGLILALAIALLLELLNRRVRSVDDIVMATHLPVLGTVPAASNRFAALPMARQRLAYSPGSSAT
ncbi:chain length determinant protein EpsF [Ramlibacter sp. AW1]|uniref:Chain length determinant protein EpsF n=1 Tax=Ramlibacter aurantiacus TaxID=2801330 RepID=A0A936ZMU3_9BURK|nr:Wzz/FepE/Etk N-terminal domain-containing protein [Ramlibacter aurantiacus]MBL0420190.1 chain length determinant protein EpsF [Ramlibacter aurantiacus]